MALGLKVVIDVYLIVFQHMLLQQNYWQFKSWIEGGWSHYIGSKPKAAHSDQKMKLKIS
jgi:hypothetical protein